MLTLIATFTLLAAKPAPPAWVRDLLQSAPPTPAPIPVAVPTTLAPPERIGSGVDQVMEHRSGVSAPSHDFGAADYAVSERRVDALVSTGRFEDAYQAAIGIFPVDRLDSAWDRLALASLVAGHTAHLERLLIRCVRDKSETFGGNTEAYDELSYATAMQGRLYPGQGAYAFASLREALKWKTLPANLEDGHTLKSPRTAKEVAFANLLTLGLKLPRPYSIACLEGALAQDPACEIAARRWFLEDDGSRVDQGIRIAQGMVDRLPVGKGRDDFARKLAAYRDKKAALATAGTSRS